MRDAHTARMDPKRNPTNGISKALIILASIGALNWGLVGFFNYNLVDAIFGGGAREMTSTASRVIYAIVGLAGLVSLLLLPKLHAEPLHRRHLADRAV
jgi:uncharacterized membrane protein YuzA (DUF378 family)